MTSACGGNGGAGNLGGGGTPPPAKTEFLYATSTYGVLNYTIDPATGILAAPTITLGPVGTFGIAVTPNKEYLYANHGQASGIDAYTISQSGVLTTIAGSPFALPVSNTPNLMDAIAMHPSGKLLYTVEAGAKVIAGYEIDAGSGALTSVVGSPFATSDTPLTALVDPSGKFLYVGDLSGISAFTIDITSGSLTPLTGSPFPINGGAYGIAVDSSGKFLFVGQQWGNLGIRVFSIDGTTGALAQVEGSPFVGSEQTTYVALHPTGKFLYALGSYDGRVFGYSIDSNSGALTPLAGSPFGLPIPLVDDTVAVDPSGQFLYAGGVNYNGVLSYRIDSSTGALTAITPAGNPTGDQQMGSYPLGLLGLELP